MAAAAAMSSAERAMACSFSVEVGSQCAWRGSPAPDAPSYRNSGIAGHRYPPVGVQQLRVHANGPSPGVVRAVLGLLPFLGSSPAPGSPSWRLRRTSLNAKWDLSRFAIFEFNSVTLFACIGFTRQRFSFVALYDDLP